MYDLYHMYRTADLHFESGHISTHLPQVIASPITHTLVSELTHFQKYEA